MIYIVIQFTVLTYKIQCIIWFLPASRTLRLVIRLPAGPKITLLFPRLFVHPHYHVCNNLHHVHSCHVTLLCVATMSSLAQLWVQDGYWEAEAMQMQQHKADQEWKRQKRAATHDGYRITNQQRMAARRDLEWTRISKARMIFKYERSDLFCVHKPLLSNLSTFLRPQPPTH